MTAPPARTDLSATPSPSNAVAKAALGTWWDVLFKAGTGLLGTTGNAVDARAALGAAKSGANSDITSLTGLTGPINEARSTVVGNATTSDIWGATSAGTMAMTGTPTVTTFPAAPQPGAKRRIYPAAGTIFVHSATLDIRGNANFTAVAGDFVDVEAITTTTFILIPNKDDGTPIVGDTRYAPLGAGPIQGAFRNLAGSAPGTSAVVTYTLDELVTGDGAGNYQTTRAWNGAITMTTLGVGGLDVGTVAANSWYYAYGITKPDGTKAFIASLSSTGPSFANAAGYTKSARIGPIRTDGTANKYPLTFQQYGRNIQYKLVAGTNMALLLAIASGVQGTTGTTLVAAAIGALVPPTASRIRGLVFTNGGTTQIAPNAIATLQGGAGVVASGSTATPSTPFDYAIESTNLYYASNATSSGAYCLGFEDNI